jgi:hypothetical protein
MLLASSKGVASSLEMTRRERRPQSGACSGTQPAPCSSTMGPRGVFTSLAYGFLSASSSAPTSPFVRLLRIKCSQDVGSPEQFLLGDKLRAG